MNEREQVAAQAVADLTELLGYEVRTLTVVGTPGGEYAVRCEGSSPEEFDAFGFTVS